MKVRPAELGEVEPVDEPVDGVELLRRRLWL